MPALHNRKWEEACQAYVLKGISKTDAFRHAYPLNRSSKATQAVRGNELFKRDTVVARVAELQALKTELANKEFGVDAAYILRRLFEIDQMDVLDILDDDDCLKPVKDWPTIWRQFIQQFDVEELFAGKGSDKLKIGLLKKIKWPDKIRNLELLGKHINVSAFKENIGLTGPGGGPVQVIGTKMSAKEASEAYADTLREN